MSNFWSKVKSALLGAVDGASHPVDPMDGPVAKQAAELQADIQQQTLQVANSILSQQGWGTSASTWKPNKGAKFLDDCRESIGIPRVNDYLHPYPGGAFTTTIPHIRSTTQSVGQVKLSPGKIINVDKI